MTDFYSVGSYVEAHRLGCTAFVPFGGVSMVELLLRAQTIQVTERHTNA